MFGSFDPKLEQISADIKRYHQMQLDSQLRMESAMIRNGPDIIDYWNRCEPPSLLDWLFKW